MDKLKIFILTGLYVIASYQDGRTIGGRNMLFFRSCLVGLVTLIFSGYLSASDFSNIGGIKESEDEPGVATLAATQGYCWTCYWDFKNVPLGQLKETNQAAYAVGSDLKITFHSPVQSGSTDFKLTQNLCTGTTIQDSNCKISVSFKPSSVGQKSGLIKFPATVCGRSSAESEWVCGPETLFIHLKGTSVEERPEEECEKCGSIVRVDSQTLTESIPIVGSDLRLVYSSGITPNYISKYNTLGVKGVFNLHGWTFSLQHFLNRAELRLYKGSGEVETVKVKQAGGSQYQVVNSASGEVYVFDAGGRHIKTLYALTGATKYTFNYNSDGNRLLSVVDAFANTISFDWESGSLKSITTPYGQITTIARNTNNLISAVTNPQGEVYRLTYKPGTRLVETFMRPGGQTSTYSYDAGGRLIRNQGPSGSYWDLAEIDPPAKTITVTSRMGRKTTVEISKTMESPYVRKETNPDGSVISFSQHFSKDWTTTQDNKGRVAVQNVPDERFGGSALRAATTKLAMNGVESTTTFGQTVIWPPNVTPDFFNFSTLTKTTSIDGRTSTSTFDPATRTWNTTSPAGVTSTTTLNAFEHPVRYQLGADTPWMISYDSKGRVQQRGQSGTNHKVFAYNSAGIVSSITNALNERTDFTYDLAGRLSQIKLPDLRVINYTYDPNGNIASITPPSRGAHAFTYSAFDSIASYAPPSVGAGAKDTLYAYNGDKQLTKITRPDGAAINFVYDAVKERLNSITTPTGNYSFGYHTTNQRQNRITSPTGVQNLFTFYGSYVASDSQIRSSDSYLFGKVTFTYDVSHRRKSRTVQGNLATDTSAINYTYNADDMPTKVGDLSLAYTYPSGRLARTTIGSIRDTRTYDAFGNLKSYTATHTPSSTVLYSYSLTRDLMSRIVEKQETIQGVTSTYSYTYDSAGRLETVKKNNVITDSFVYDGNSNRIQGRIKGANFTATYDEQDRIQTFNSQVYSHNANGDLTRVQWNSTQQSLFTYDVMGNLRQVTLPSGSVVKYQHDGLDRRVNKKTGTTNNWRYLFEDKYRIAAQLNSSNAIQKVFIYATRVNVPDYFVDATGAKFKLITDHLGSPRLVVNAADGAVIQRMDYSTLGEVTTHTSPALHPFGFAGGTYDTSTKLVRFGARDYDPRSGGRWTTKDPIRFKGGDLNLYGYVLADPINNIDHRGLRNNCSGYDIFKEQARKDRNALAKMLDYRKVCPPEEREELDEAIDSLKEDIGEWERNQIRENDSCNANPSGSD